jgi:lysozyme
MASDVAKILSWDMIRRHEGFVAKPYQDSLGNWTIGYGRNLNNGISEAEASMLAKHDIEHTIRMLDSMPWYSRLSNIRQAALIDMAYNLGDTGFLRFTKTILALKLGNYKTAAEEMLWSTWHKQVGERAKEIAYMIEHDKIKEVT